MAGLDNIPQKTTVEIEVVKLDENVLESIKDLNQNLIFNGNLTLNGTASITYLNVAYESASN